MVGVQVRQHDDVDGLGRRAERAQILRQLAEVVLHRLQALPRSGVAQNELAAMADQEAVDVERHRLAVGDAGELGALLGRDAEDDVVVAVQHPVGDGGDGELADLPCAQAAAASAGLPRIMSEAFSAIISTQALMWAETRSGIAEASTTRSCSTPCTRNCGSTTVWGPVPIMQVEAGWLAVAATFLIQLSISASVCTLGPGDSSAPRKRASGGCAATSRAILKPWRKVGRSLGADKKFVTIFTLSRGSFERSSTSPRLSGCSRQGRMP